MNDAPRLNLGDNQPTLGEDLDTPSPAPEMLMRLWRRRSNLAQDMVAPGPDKDQIRELLTIAARVPDHGKLAPWRFIVFDGPARTEAGEVLARLFKANQPDAPESLIEFEECRFERAPVVIAVVSTAAEHVNIPQWEQILSAGAVCQNLLLAAGAMGFGAQWLTEWCAYDAEVLKAFGLSEDEKIAGYIYVGTVEKAPMERARPDLAERVGYWGN